ncbi:MAG: TRAP transporter large permease subunit, partial [Pseudomonadota bacterium]|nr:TRAP transporter large permease subunit [Pseudomonadota bacterium]
MSPLEIGMLSVAAIVFLIYMGLYIPITLGVVSFVSIWLMRDNFDLAMNLLKVAVSDSVMEYTFATVPLFTFMGLIVSKAGLGSDVYEVMSSGFRRVKGGIGMATLGA